MLSCPMCKKTLTSLGKQCPSCKADVSLLVTYIEDLDNGLARAEACTRAGDLDAAVWAYLEVLEVDPDNETARRQVGRVAAAVRQFDRLAPGRRWLDGIQRQARSKQWLQSWGLEGAPPRALQFGLGLAVVAILIIGAVFAGYFLGQHGHRRSPPSSVESTNDQ
jgi:hypothetical protein